MSLGIPFKDTIKFVSSTYSGYGDKEANEVITVPALFSQGTGLSHSAHVDHTTSQSYAYVDPKNPFIVNNWNRLEGMSVIASYFDSPESESWYKVETVTIGQAKLLDNKIDHVLVHLSKSEEMENVS